MSITSGTSSSVLTIAFTCVGRRVELLQAFRRAARQLGVSLRLVGIDSDPSAPALSCVDIPVLAPRADNGGYLAAMETAVRTHAVRALIPTTDTDLRLLSRARDQLGRLGCISMLAEAPIIDICRDKTLTFQHLLRHGIDTPTTYTADEIRSLHTKPFPLFIKPRTGSASQWVHKINDALDLDYHLQRVHDPIIQEFVSGVEHTLDVYVGLTGEPRCVVPRARWQVRTGEVSKGVVVKDLEIMNAGRRVVETLGPTPRGLVTLQCIVTPERRIRFIEINPRFGGGAPLGIAAGADYPRWLIQELLGRSPQIAFDGFQHGMCMLRYDWSVFMPLGDDLQPKLSTPVTRIPDFL